MKLSIVTVSFNAENCIEKTILSVLNQTMPVYEYIMVDGGSKDKTYEIIKSYEQKFKNKGIRFLFHSEPDRGISDAFNKGIAQATGDVIGIINADDELIPEANSVLNKTYNEKDAGVYYGNCLWVDNVRGTEHISYPKHDLARLLYYMVLIHPSTFVKRKVYEEFGVFDITYRYCMDKELLYRFYKAGVQFQYVDATLTKFKAGGVSDTNTVKVLKEGSRMALDNGENVIKVKMIEYKERVRVAIVKKIKKTPVYDALKKTRKI